MDNINVSYSYQIGSNAKSNVPAPTTDSDGRTYAYLDYEEIIINEKSVMIMNMHSRNKMVVTREVANALTTVLTSKRYPITQRSCVPPFQYCAISTRMFYRYWITPEGREFW